MSVEISDFIMVMDDAYTKDECERFIQVYDVAEASGMTMTRQEREGALPSQKKDGSCFVSNFNFEHSSEAASFTDKFWEKIHPHYANAFPESLNDSSNEYKIYTIKLQKTRKSEGYHVWHYESGARRACHRLMAWVLYLNDVEEGGETEFLYQSRRVSAKQGRFVLFPAAYTHLHRGNPPLSNDKYIATGWLEL